MNWEFIDLMALTIICHIHLLHPKFVHHKFSRFTFDITYLCAYIQRIFPYRLGLPNLDEKENLLEKKSLFFVSLDPKNNHK